MDFALYQQRLQKFDFDITTIALPGARTTRARNLPTCSGSQAADQEDSGNFPGVKNPAVDAAIRAMVSARTLDQVLPACHRAWTASSPTSIT
ncbi:ABC transporter substrate-binding protein [Alicycliphilus sp. B1]|nr:ABC transporter substrate-binding protein [Alicycliphilus sp. B1]